MEVLDLVSVFVFGSVPSSSSSLSSFSSSLVGLKSDAGTCCLARVSRRCVVFPAPTYRRPHRPSEEIYHIRLLVGGENVLASFCKHWLGDENDAGLANRIRLVRGARGTHLHLQTFWYNYAIASDTHIDWARLWSVPPSVSLGLGCITCRIVRSTTAVGYSHYLGRFPRLWPIPFEVGRVYIFALLFQRGISRGWSYVAEKRRISFSRCWVHSRFWGP